MFVGDLEPPTPLVAASEREAAAMLPGGVRVETEGASAERLPLLLIGLLVLAFLGFGVAHSTFPYPTTGERLASLGAIVGACAAAGAVGHWVFVKHRKKFRLDDDGIVMEVWHRADGSPWVTRIPWTEIADYTVSVTPEAATLRVISVRGYTVTLRDRPARLSTRELIRRFVERAEQYPRAVRPAPAPAEDPGWVPPVLVGEQDTSTWGFLAYMGIVVLLMVGLPLLGSAAGVPEVPDRFRGAVLAAVVLLVGGWHFWTALDDPDVAPADRDSRRLMARLRRWLREALGVRAT